MAKCRPIVRRQWCVSGHHQHRFSEATRVWRDRDLVGADQAGEHISGAGVKRWSNLGGALHVQSNGSVTIYARGGKREAGGGRGPAEYRFFTAVQGLSPPAGE